MDPEEKERARYAHKLALQKLVIEKLLLGVVVVLIGVIANLIVEEYRSGLIRERFILEKQFDAIIEIKTAYEELQQFFDDHTVDVALVELPDDYEAKHAALIDQYIAVNNKWGAVFPGDIIKQLDYFLWLHLGIQYKTLASFRTMSWEELLEHRTFMVAMRESFYAFSRKAMGIESEESVATFQPDAITFAEASNMGAEIYYDNNFNRWKRERFR